MNQLISPWIHSARFDGVFILAPAFIVSLAVLAYPSLFRHANDLPLSWWVGLVLCIDVAHVYSTLFRSYFDPVERRARSGLLFVVPLGCWFAGILAYSLGSHVFWSILAYLAVFHFVRQQYGFFMIYSRGDIGVTAWGRKVDKAAIYLATIYPLVFWHANLPRNFVWFIEGDFIALPLQLLKMLIGVTYALTLVIYFAKELAVWRRYRFVNLPKQLLLSGTAVAWYVGIILYNGDMAFTLTNVVTHGIPYLALIWLYGRKRWRSTPSGPEATSLATLFQIRLVPLFLIFLIGLAYIEESLWDALIWRDRATLFAPWYILPHVVTKDILIWLVPLLAVPQATHYILDAFLWRGSKPKERVDALFPSNP